MKKWLDEHHETIIWTFILVGLILIVVATFTGNLD